MEPFTSVIVGALIAGAAAGSKKVASTAITDAYDALKKLVIRKLGKGGAVQSVEDDPDSKLAQASLIDAVEKAQLQSDQELRDHVAALEKALAEAKKDNVPGAQDINIDGIYGATRALAEDIDATGNVSLGSIISPKGSAVARRITAGSPTRKGRSGSKKK